MTEADAKTRILDAAEQAFADRGLAGARVAAIAEDAHVNKAMLYYYFASKEALFQAVVERVFGQIAAMVATVGGDVVGAPDASIRAFLAGYRAVLAEHPAFARLLVRTILDHPDTLVEIVGPRISALLPVVVAIVGQGQAAGALNPALDPPLVPPSIISPILFGLLARPLLERITGDPAVSERWDRHHTELVLHGLIAREKP